MQRQQIHQRLAARLRRRQRPAPGIAHPPQPALFGHKGTRLEIPEVQGLQIELAFSLRIGIEIDLKSPVDLKSLDSVGRHAAADSVARLQQQHAPAGPHQFPRAGQPCQARAHDDAVGGVHEAITATRAYSGRTTDCVR